MADRRQYRETVYGNKAVDEAGWFQPHAASLRRLIEGCLDTQPKFITPRRPRSRNLSIVVAGASNHA